MPHKDPTSYSIITYFWVTAAFSGLLAFWGCEAAGFDPLWTAVLVGISGHMGTRALYQIEILAQRKLGLPDPTTETSHDQQP